MDNNECIEIAEEILSETPMFFGKTKPLIANKRYDALKLLINLIKNNEDHLNSLPTKKEILNIIYEYVSGLGSGGLLGSPNGLATAIYKRIQEKKKETNEKEKEQD